ncbi:lysine 5,6-aminomutase reactivase ATPase KamC [Thermoactinomyces mirandus]|uniref:Uncharacterized protein n=1 Tax=Thermoactinomyces mirandus TaxID=2756294 RepID=A0A7W1XTI2_9BACL|nr:hypothetical protein [Thermoactinomyces mirandus]MBA4602911.1 hypothetical protein [Thermoactinomyces mirandus]
MVFCDRQTEEDLDLSFCFQWFQPLTPYGRQRKKELSPFLPGQEDAWQQCLQEQETMIRLMKDHSGFTESLSRRLGNIPDISPVLRKLAESETPQLTEWFDLKTFLWALKEIHLLLQKTALSSLIFPDGQTASKCEHAIRLLNPSPELTPTFWFDDAYDERLKMSRKKWRQLRAGQQRENEQTAQRIEQKTGRLRNRFGEWVVPKKPDQFLAWETMPELEHVRETVHEVVYRCKPVGNGEIDRLEEEIARLEQEVSERLVQKFAPLVPELESWLQKITHLDLQCARVRAAEHWQGVRPRWSPDHFRMEGAFHPAVEKQLAEEGCSMTRLDCTIRQGVTVIIGPNMGGKTVALRTLGLVAVLSQWGFFVPASSCEMPLFSWVAGIMGDKQGIRQGLSRFGAEMARLRDWISRKETGLLLLDEIGSGTNPVEGSALSEAVTAYLAKQPYWTVHVTHYREVLAVKKIRLYQVSGISGRLKVPAEKQTVREIRQTLREMMDYRLVSVTKAASVPHEALWIVEQLGLPSQIVRLARQKVAGRGMDNG